MSTHDERLRTYWLQALVSAARAATSPAVRRAHAQAVATVAKSAPEPRAARLIADAVQLYTEPGACSCCVCQNIHSVALLILPGIRLSLVEDVCLILRRSPLQEMQAPGSSQACC